jgi:2-C-methyl-D-erythritol 4-phosphate cytidylyltransferase
LGAAVSAFASCPEIGPIIITVPPGDENGAALSCLPAELRSSALPSSKEQNRIRFISGGISRRASVHKALIILKAYNPSHVLIHDGARPWIKRELIRKIIKTASRYKAVIPALPLVETPKELDPSRDFIIKHLKRGNISIAQTPQGFKFPEILLAHEKAGEKEEREAFEYTDDAEVWGEYQGQVAVIPGDPQNRKITYPEDLLR